MVNKNRIFNDIMSLPEVFDFYDMLDKMSKEERELTFKYAVDITKLEKEGKTPAEIEALIKENIAKHRAEMKERGLIKSKSES